jgi:hypothetical protein
MPRLVSFEFPSTGPFGQEAAEAYAELAADIATEDGLIWKVWTEDPATSIAGGVYLFVDEGAAAGYIDKHTRRLESFGITDIRAVSLDVNEPLSRVTHASLSRA